jgi:7,8-dihydropterin-6-yl-methyl-4-(beta-D-ribofuranosyl)aminobenzene 5'-phosphate synthase
MCTDQTPAAHRQPPGAHVLHDFDPDIVYDLEPVDAVTVTTLMDNVTDIFMPDQGPARRPPGGTRARVPVRTMEGGDGPDPLRAEHGFSVLVSVAKNGSEHHVLFDAGVSPDGVVENMRRLDIDPASIEAIICSHGHFDHTTGLDGLIRALGGTVSLPVLIHPHFWRRRRVTIPGLDRQEIPTTSRSALTGAGFEVIEEGHPSFLFHRSVLITGEVPGSRRSRPGSAGVGHRIRWC